jgi:putative peptide zinc metalloprotease protein
LAAHLGLEDAAVNSPLLSSLWYRVANLKPTLRSHARLHRHHYRGEVWHLLQDPASGRILRFTPAARLIIGLMDGRHTVAALWEVANRRLGENAPTQDEVIQLLGQLHAADLLRSDVTPDVAELFTRAEREERVRVFRSFGNPMAIRVPFWDPDRFLNRFPSLIRFIWGRWGAAIWLLTVLPAVFLIPPHWPELSNNFADRVLSVDNLFILYLVFPILKAFHELGHATATKAGGGEVHDMGVIFLVLLPVPYVEASAASTFRSKYRRAIVGAAGMAVELFIAALAFYLWLLVEQGVARAILYNVMVIAGVSTLIFNGNPLLRYDAYYILADLIEMPNLALRSTRYWSYLLEHYILGVSELESPHASRAEKAWFIFYGAASTIYRIVVTVFIALFIAGRFYFIGVLLALWAVGAMAVLPLVRGVRHLSGSARLRRHRTRAIVATVGTVAALLAFLGLVPIPSHTEAQGVVWLPENALVRAGTNCFLEEFLAQPGSRVSLGDPLVKCSDPQLEAQVKVAEAKVQELEATVSAETPTDRTRIELARHKLEHAQRIFEIMRVKAADLIVRAGADGVFDVQQKEDMPGRYYRQGELLGHVIGELDPLVRVVVPQDAIDRVRAATDRIRLRVVDHPETVLDGRLVRAVPKGEELLPSRALAVEGGGAIATDPRETTAPKALQRMFQFDVGLDDASRVRYFGQRVFVRFEHVGEPLSVQWYRSIRLLFLSRFNV